MPITWFSFKRVFLRSICMVHPCSSVQSCILTKMDLSNIPALNGDHKKQKSRWNKNIVYFLREGQKMQKEVFEGFQVVMKVYQNEYHFTCTP